MRKFRRIETRVGFETEAHWQKGYEFVSNDFNMLPAFGSCFAYDHDTGTRHDMTSLEAVKMEA